VGDEGPWVVGINGSWDKILPIVLCEFPVVLAKPRNPLPGGV
jgi:hypothetical protein